MQSTPFDNMIEKVKDPTLITCFQLLQAGYANAYAVTAECSAWGVDFWKAFNDRDNVSMARMRTRASLAYWDFIALVQRVERLLKKQGYDVSLMPLSKEIYFFRNKVSEHIEDYFLKGQIFPSSHAEKFGSVIVPAHHSGKIPFSNIATLFKKYYPQEPLPDLSSDKSLYEASDILFVYLKKMDPSLQRIPEEIVVALFNYIFPYPVQNIEKFSEELGSFLIRLDGKSNA